MEPRAIPGFVLANRALSRQRAVMVDVYPSILALLGVEAPERVPGRSFVADRVGLR